MVADVAVPGDLGGANHAADSESPPVAQAPGPAVPGPTGCQSAPGMTQRVHQLIRLVSKGMPDCECGEQNLMADAFPESIMHEPVQPPRQLAHPLGRHRLRTPGTPPRTAGR